MIRNQTTGNILTKQPPNTRNKSKRRRNTGDI
jgi:hypothetical protein